MPIDSATSRIQKHGGIPLISVEQRLNFLFSLLYFAPPPRPLPPVHLSPCFPSPPVTRGPSSLYICLSDSSAGSPGQLRGGVAAISRAPLMCYRVRRRWRREREGGGGSGRTSVRLIRDDPGRWFPPLPSSVLSRSVVSSRAPNGLLMTARRHRPHARPFISISTERPERVRRV